MKHCRFMKSSVHLAQGERPMKGPKNPLIWLVLMLVTAPAAYPTGGDTDKDIKVIVRLHNCSVLQPAVLLDAIEVDSKIGKLAIPGRELRRIDFGIRLSGDETKKVDQAIKDLNSDNAATRATATKTLTTMGRLAYPALLEQKKTAETEAG